MNGLYHFYTSVYFLLINQHTFLIYYGMISLTFETNFETRNIDYLKNMVESGFPIVLFNRVSDVIPSHKVVFDDYKWAFFATEHLIYQGYKKIFHFSGPKTLSFAQNRINGFVDALKKHKIPVSDQLIFESGLLIKDGERVMQKLLDDKNIPEAIFAVNDPSAIGAIKTLKKNGFKIPGDIAIVGFTESKLAELIDPPLTTVAQPTFEIGQTAARLLLEQIGSKVIFVPQKVVLNGRLNVRESSMRL